MAAGIAIAAVFLAISTVITLIIMHKSVKRLEELNSKKRKK